MSDLAQLLQEIDRQNEAAYQGLHGLAYGASQHAFITAKMERIAALKERLAPRIGEEAARHTHIHPLGQSPGQRRKSVMSL